MPSAPMATACIAVAGGSAAAFDFIWGLEGLRSDRKSSVLLDSLLVRCQSWNLANKLERNKGKSMPADNKEEEMPLAEDHRKIEEYYEMGIELGAGVHAKVFQGRNKASRQLVAIKRVEKANMRRRQLAREIEILTTVTHPNVISLKDVFEDEQHVYLVLVLT